MATLTTFFRKRKTIKKAKDKANPTPKVKPKQLIKNKKPGNTGKKSNREITNKITGLVAWLLANFETRADIVVIIGEKYGIGDKMVDVYIKKARMKLAEAIAGSVDEYIQRSIFRLKSITQKAAKSNNLNIVLGAEKEINRILIPRKHIIAGMGKDGKIEHSVDIGAIIAKDKTRAAEVVQILHECSGNA